MEQNQYPKIWNMLQYPDKELNEEEINLLGELLEAHPYFQPLHFLKAYKVFHSGQRSPRKNRYLSRLMAHTGDPLAIWHHFDESKSAYEHVKSVKDGYFSGQSTKHVKPETTASSKTEVEDANSGEKQEPENKDEEAEVKFSGSFLQWLDKIRNRKSKPSEKKVVNLPKKTEKEQKEQLDEQAILDRFIERQPKISRVKREVFSAENMAKKSIHDDEEFVTETLAKINYRQGNYNKAIRIYEKLGLKYPDKFTYFAEEIEKIKKEKNKK